MIIILGLMSIRQTVLPGVAAVAAISSRTSVREFISEATGELVIVRSLVPLLYTPRFYGF